MSHWYQRDGSPLFKVKALSGEMRATTLRDARKLNLVPSVTTILDILGKPGLVKWQVDQGILAALTLSRNPNEPDEDFLIRLYKDSRSQFINAGIVGDQIHDSCERAFSGKSVSPEFIPHTTAVKDTLSLYFPDINDWVTEKPFAHPLGFGGKVDLHSPSTKLIVDFKGKDFTPEDKKVLKFEQHWQLGGYQIGLDFPIGPGANVFISRNSPGHVHIHVWNKEEMAYGREVFLATFKLWKTMKKYDPVFAKSEKDRELMTDEEWLGLSAESRFRINEFFSRMAKSQSQ